MPYTDDHDGEYCAEEDNPPSGEFPKQQVRNSAIHTLAWALTYLDAAHTGLVHNGKQASADLLAIHISALSLHLETLEQPELTQSVHAAKQNWRDELILAVDLATESAKSQVWYEDVQALQQESELILAKARGANDEERQSPIRPIAKPKMWWMCSCQ